VLNEIIFFDMEIDSAGKNILDIGAINTSGDEFHSNSSAAFLNVLGNYKYICGHNIINHDINYLTLPQNILPVDTLFLSPLLFPKKPYHKLVKDDKLDTDELNNPLNDAKKARDLFFDEVTEFNNLAPKLQSVFYNLLHKKPEFENFFVFTNCDTTTSNVSELIAEIFAGRLCENAPLEKLAQKYPIELSYALALIGVIEYDSVTPPWVLKNFPRVENIMYFLRSRKCESCPYCDESLDEIKALKRFFHYDNFRRYDGEPLQQSAVKAAVAGKSILAVFPTGGGKSITFQLPALMAGVNERGLTVVISPLQSLMKDQTDNLENQHSITQAVTINGSLDPLERAKAFDRVQDGSASLLYISPESLRSKSIEKLLASRNVVRFVIDEAHCFSSWGQDFRVDYLYIGEFIKNLQTIKNMPQSIPVSCFTATAKRPVIADIKKYFEENLSLKLEVFTASSGRANLSYHIFPEESKDGKDLKLRQLLTDNNCPTIIYVSRTRRTEELSTKLSQDGFPAKAYHGQMDKQLRVANQDAFMNGEVDIIVATTAFGMGVDKKDIGMVIHYDISDSLENYVQEAGRAGRDENIKASCFALYSDDDLNKHFHMLNQTKLSKKEINQIWRALKNLTKARANISQSTLEIARTAGWDDSVRDMETRVKTAINALEQSGFVKRGQNMPRIFADSILVKNMEEARARIDKSPRFDDSSRQQAIRIIGSLISSKGRQKGSDEGESRIDYISDRLGIVKEDLIRVLGLLREERLLSDAKDLVAYIDRIAQNQKNILATHINIEIFLCSFLSHEEKSYNIKEINEALQSEHANTSIKQLSTVMNYFEIKRFIKRTHEYNKNYVAIKPYLPLDELLHKSIRRHEIAGFIINYLHSKPQDKAGNDAPVLFSVLELKNELNQSLIAKHAEQEEIEDALYYLLKIGAMKIEGGFLVIYNAMRIERLEKNNKAQYNKEHYEKLEEYYKNKRQQIHIVGEYANRLIEDYNSAMDFVNDYFVMDYNMFLVKYFRGRRDEISENITPKKFKQLFGELSPKQLGIIKDQSSRYIVVAAGPGSGKTKLLVHKLASLYMMEDVKHEQMLMLTFSRAAATEFKTRLMTLIGNAANFIQIMTFHSYCFDLLGKVGDIKKSDNVIEQTLNKIKSGEVDRSRVTKTVLVIDEAQDMSEVEYALVKLLIRLNDEMRVIAVGDDDQNIYDFRGSNSEYFSSLMNEQGAKKYELTENYRSSRSIVDFANSFAETISQRLKSTPIMPKTTNAGKVYLRKLQSANIEVPVVNAIIRTMSTGTTCIITRTNREAFNIIGLLQQEGISARQIQTNDGFNLQNLCELRYFAECFSGDSYTISEDTWQSAKLKLRRKYEGSENLQWVLKLLKNFEDTHNTTKYKSDFTAFVRESKLEDFISEQDTVLVSTIHQTKGREFDNVFFALSPFFGQISDKDKRAIYVALTRAKTNLHIYTNANYFDGINFADMEKFTDKTTYPPPSRLCFQLSHTEVNLGYFRKTREDILSLVSGQVLSVNESGCTFCGKQVLKFSESFLQEVEKLKTRGFFAEKAYVRHMVFWKGKDANEELKIILPNIEFVKI